MGSIKILLWMILVALILNLIVNIGQAKRFEIEDCILGRSHGLPEAYLHVMNH